ncbi:MAG: glycosyl transferase family protein [Pseudooceanicola sp.]
MSLAAHVRTLGRGPGRSRSLTREEAEDAMATILRGEAAPEAVGALMMLLRMKGETPDEIAGFTAAARASLPALPRADLDWPSYAAGRTRGLPYFLLSARLVSLSGHRVLLHGWNSTVTAIRDGLAPAGISLADTPAAAKRHLDDARIAYMPLETLSPPLVGLLSLRRVLGLRSCVNTVCRMLNPASAAAGVQGVFHPSYRELQTGAAAILGWRNLSIVKGGGGEFERSPAKDIAVHGLRAGAEYRATAPARMEETRRLDDGRRDADRLAALWTGMLRDPFAEEIVIGTAALALDTLGDATPAATARRLWADRPQLVRA